MAIDLLGLEFDLTFFLKLSTRRLLCSSYVSIFYKDEMGVHICKVWVSQIMETQKRFEMKRM